tara:strand:+ start:1230 stop:2192 length:963 start_codon:yes stop_codon:yes gene_type:complete
MDEEKEITFFEELKDLRKSKDVKLIDISNSTKINIKYLEAIENGNFDALPNIYIRLFIRTYCEFLLIDSDEVLNKYEQHTNIKSKKFIKKTVSKEVKQQTPNFMKINKDEKNSQEKTKEPQTDLFKKTIISTKKTNKINFNQEYFYDNKKIFTGVLTGCSIFIIYMLVSYLSTEQKNKLEATSNNNNNEINHSVIIDDKLISEDDFDKDKLISETNKKLKFKVNTPYTFQITTREKTKIYVSYDNENGKRLEACNIIAPKDTLLKFDNSNNIYFDIWNSDHVEVAINNKPISKYLNQKNALIRGSYSPKNNRLYLKSYSH